MTQAPYTMARNMALPADPELAHVLAITLKRAGDATIACALAGTLYSLAADAYKAAGDATMKRELIKGFAEKEMECRAKGAGLLARMGGRG